MSILVSIIIPTYNREHLILDTLKSVQNQSYYNFECIIVDDTSTDNTAEIVRCFCNNDSRFKYLERPLNRLKGANACRNFGLENSKGNFINWLDSDDLIIPDHVKKHLLVHESNKNMTASVSEAGIFNEIIGDSDKKWSNISSTDDLLGDMLSSKVSWQTASVLWRKDKLPQRPFREDLSSSQEWTFHLTQIINGLHFNRFNFITVYVRRHEVRTGKDISKHKFNSMFFSRYLIFKKLYKDKKLTKQYQGALINKMLQAIKKTIYYKYDKSLFWQVLKLWSILFIVNAKWRILKILLFSIPMYRITGKGETLFKI